MKQYIIWYEFDGEEDFTVITAEDEDEALRRFRGWHSERVTDCHEIEDSEAYLAWV